MPRVAGLWWVDIRCTRTGNPLCGRTDTGLLYNPAMRDGGLNTRYLWIGYTLSMGGLHTFWGWIYVLGRGMNWHKFNINIILGWIFYVQAEIITT